MHKDQRTPESIQRGDQRPASSPERRGQRPTVFAGTTGKAIALGTSWVASAAPTPHAGSSNAVTGIEVLSEVVTRSMLVGCARQRGVKNWVYGGRVNFLGAAGGLLCARGRRTSRCGWSSVPVSRKYGIAPVKLSTTRPKFARIAPVSGTCHVELDKLHKSNSTKCKISPKRLLLVEFVFFRSLQIRT